MKHESIRKDFNVKQVHSLFYTFLHFIQYHFSLDHILCVDSRPSDRLWTAKGPASFFTILHHSSCVRHSLKLTARLRRWPWEKRSLLSYGHCPFLDTKCVECSEQFTNSFFLLHHMKKTSQAIRTQKISGTRRLPTNKTLPVDALSTNKFYLDWTKKYS